MCTGDCKLHPSSDALKAENINTVFSRSMSQMVKGIAILMMIAHHCFAFPDFWLNDFRVGTVTALVSNQFKICVAIFAFITGYGFYAGRSYTYKQTIRKTIRFLLQYWLQLFFIFLPVASISYDFSLSKIVHNLIALYDNIVLFAWYVFFHCYVLLTFPFAKKFLNGSVAQGLAVVLAGGYCVTVFFYFLPLDGPLFSMLFDCSVYYPVVGIGYLFAKYNVFDRLGKKLSTMVAAVVIPVIILVRTQLSVIKGFSFDVFYAPLCILSLCRILAKCPIVHPILQFLGKHSFHMWLFHSIFFSAYTRELIQPLVSWTDIPFMRFLLVTVMSTAAAVLIDFVWKSGTALFERVRNSLSK